MKRLILTIIAASAIAASVAAQAPESKSISSSLGLFVFPEKGQDKATQDADELASYQWAMEQTGYDPMNPTQVQAEQVDRSPDGSAVAGGAKGAAVGAAIGAISGDAGKGAAIGAVAGGVAGRRASKVGNEIEQQQNNADAEAQEQKMKDDFIRAFTAGMEAKGYSVK